MRDLPGTAQRLAEILDRNADDTIGVQYMWQRADGEIVQVDIVGPLITVKGFKKGELIHNFSIDAESHEHAIQSVDNLMRQEAV